MNGDVCCSVACDGTHGKKGGGGEADSTTAPWTEIRIFENCPFFFPEKFDDRNDDFKLITLTTTYILALYILTIVVKTSQSSCLCCVIPQKTVVL